MAIHQVDLSDLIKTRNSYY